jgi:hypothetical protein
LPEQEEVPVQQLGRLGCVYTYIGQFHTEPLIICHIPTS